MNIEKGSQVRVHGGDITLQFFVSGTLAVVNETTMRTVKVTFLETFAGSQAEFLIQQCVPASISEETKNETVHPERIS
jgi:hypothetical protein